MSVQFGTFGSFTTARLGIYAAQSSLNVTGNNIANMNTRGYTRQRADLVSLYPSGQARYNSSYNLSIGYGVLVDSVSQLRDPFLDIRYRSQNAAAAAFEAKLDGLRQLGNILDEVGKGEDGFGVIEDQLGGFIEMLQSWNNLTNITQYDDLVRSAASELCALFNTAAHDLQEVYDNEVNYLEDNVKKANSLLTQIRDLNEQIRNANIFGDSALELKDARNVAIDELSSLMKINVTYSMEKIDEFTEVEKLTITLPDTKEPSYTKADIEDAWKDYCDKAGIPETDADEKKKFVAQYQSSNAGKNIKLVDGIYATQFHIAKDYTENPDYDEAFALANPNLKPDDPEYAKTCKYLTPSGEPTKDEEEADFVYDDKFLLSIDALTDKRGRYMKDPKYGTQLTQSIDLRDTDLSGAIQSMRELLTEEGEFSSKLEMGIGVEDVPVYMAFLDPNAYRAYLVGDPQANVKRGIPYYMKALDNLAQEFARTLNALNQPDQYVTGLDRDDYPIFGGGLTLKDIYKTGNVLVDDPANPGTQITIEAFVDEKGNPILDDDLNPITPADVELANHDPLELFNEDGTPNYYGGLTDTQLMAMFNEDGEPYLDPKEYGKLVTDEERAAAVTAAQRKVLADDIDKAQDKLEKVRDAGNLTDKWNFYNGGALISNSNNNNHTTGITASNISVSRDWSNGAVRVLHTVQPNDIAADGTIITHSTAGDNITHMISRLQGQRDFNATNIDTNSAATRFYFRGSFQEFFTNLAGTLAYDTNETASLYEIAELQTLDLDNDRMSVSGVDLNEEATNMMQYQKSYSAACQLLTIIDSMLDKLINGTI